MTNPETDDRIDRFMRNELVVSKFCDIAAYREYLEQLHTPDQRLRRDTFGGGIRAEIRTGTITIEGIEGLYALVSFEKCGLRMFAVAFIRNTDSQAK
jgi:hypothetical protein